MSEGSINLNIFPKAALQNLYGDIRDSVYINASIKQKIKNCLEHVNSKALWKDKKEAVISIYLLASALIANNCIDLNKHFEVNVKDII